jgi:xanthine dehydrogenase accessory factor
VRTEIYDALKRVLAEERPAALATVVAGPGLGEQMLLARGQELGSLGASNLDDAVRAWAADLLAGQRSERRSFDRAAGPAEVFLEVHPPPPQLILVGAVHTAIPLVAFARTLGYRTIVVDPRGAFATPERFAHADRLLREWPDEAFARLRLDEATALAVLSHDLKLDLPALRLALKSPLFYVGALGSRKTHRKRVAALKEEGFGDQELARIHAPIGLPLGGRSPEEIALAVIAEVVAARYGQALVRREGPP